MPILSTYKYYNEETGIMIFVINGEAEYPLDEWTKTEAMRDYTSGWKAAEEYNKLINAYIN